MTRAWLTVGDTLVTLLLLFALILFYLSPRPSIEHTMRLKPASIEINPDTNRTESNHSTSFSRLIVPEMNETMTVEAFLRMAEEMQPRVFTPIVTPKEPLLSKRLVALHARQGDPIFIRIFKEERVLEVWIKVEEKYQWLKNYAVCAYSGSLGPKLKEGDRQAPEGFYHVFQKSLNPHSKFHLSFNLGYPNAYDRAHGRTGSYLMVHGNCVSIGCYAMTDAKIEEIYQLVEKALQRGQRSVEVHIYPFRMTEENMALHSDSRWYDFWANLKEGYDYFEAEKIPPKIRVKQQRYYIEEGSI